MMRLGDDTEEPRSSVHEAPSTKIPGDQAYETPMLTTLVSVREDSSSSVAPTDGSPPRKTRLLSDIYSICTFALHMVDPTDFKEDVRSKGWKEVMDI